MATLLKPISVIALSFLLVLIWGVGWPAIAIGLPDCPPIWYSTIRLVIATVIVFTIVPLTDRLIIPKMKDLPLIFSIGFVQIGLFVMLITLGMEFVPPGRSAIIAYIFPYIVTPIAVLFFGEKLTFGKIMGLLLGAIGILLLFSPWALDWHNKNMLIGNGLLVLAAICWAGVMLHTRYATWHREPHLLLPWQMLISIVPSLVVALIFSPHPTIVLTEKFLVSMGYSSILSSGVAYWLLIILSRQLSVITMSLVLLATPVIGLLSSALIVGEELSKSIIISLVLIIVGLVFLFSQPRDTSK
jgi:drug/metabolite transporter (DMT)-like permease